MPGSAYEANGLHIDKHSERTVISLISTVNNYTSRTCTLGITALQFHNIDIQCLCNLQFKKRFHSISFLCIFAYTQKEMSVNNTNTQGDLLL
ncbi:hypothetical protein ccbrp13_06060 [Ktedonobacteria bacterium brp13]|nr:hypothetical protein ccbrp13_06060 [Ktedonobacteria bacterium brp13]